MLYGKFKSTWTDKETLGIFVPQASTGGRSATGEFLQLNLNMELVTMTPYLDEEHLAKNWELDEAYSVCWIDQDLYRKHKQAIIDSERTEKYVEELETYCDELYDILIRLIAENCRYELPTRPVKYEKEDI